MKAQLWVAILGLAWTMSLQAQEKPPPEDPAHNEIRAVRDEILDAFDKKDIDRMLTYFTDNVVVTVQNAEVLRGHDMIRDFHHRMSEGENRKVESLKSEFKVAELSTLYGGDTAVAFGDMNDHFKLSHGMEFDLHSRWTATLVKTDGKWQVATFHVSTNMFDNGVSNLLITWAAIKSGGFALVGGLLLGALGTAWWSRRKDSTPKTSGGPT